MPLDNFHPCDEELLLWTDGELRGGRASAMAEHVKACWTCRARAAQLDRTIADFVGVYQAEFDGRMPPVAGPRALLKARLAARGGASTRTADWRIAMATAVLLFIAIAAGVWRRGASRGPEISAIPNVTLTPGATNPVNIRDVCLSDESSNDPAIPAPLKRQVLAAYGLTDGAASAYEIDYLVTPQLGGTANLRNLWPEPANHTVWNARVKDALEDHLHHLVCSGQLDLATAQREISQDWVTAYKKYFRTPEPLR